MRNKTLLALSLSALLGMSSLTMTANDPGYSGPKLTDCATFSPAPGELTITQMANGLQNITMYAKSGYTLSKNLECTTEGEMLYNGNKLTTFKVSNVGEYKGMFFIATNPGDQVPADDAWDNWWLDEFTVTYTVDPDYEETLAKPDVTPYPGSTVESGYLDIIELRFADDVVVESIADKTVGLGPKVGFPDENGNPNYTVADYVVFYNVKKSETADNVVYLTNNLEGSGINDFGYFTLILPKGLITTNKGTNDEWTFDWNVNKITDSVFQLFNADSYDVYNVSGCRLLNNADAQALKALAPGLYIVNGKKVVIR